jgi:hypothetical protein
MDSDRITEMLSIMERNKKIIEDEIATLVYYMNGGLDFNDAYLTTAAQRKTMSRVIEKHYEAMAPKGSGKLF